MDLLNHARFNLPLSPTPPTGDLPLCHTHNRHTHGPLQRSHHCWSLLPDPHGPPSTRLISSSPEGSIPSTLTHSSARELGFDLAGLYSFPPLMGSQDKKFIAPPIIHSAPPTSLGGVLDSALVMQYYPLVSNIPLSPPPTLPTTTLALPDSDGDFPINLGDHHKSLPACPVGEASLPSNSSDYARLDENDELGQDSDLRLGLASLQLLSPLSPEWTSTDFNMPEASALLSEPSQEWAWHSEFDDSQPRSSGVMDISSRSHDQAPVKLPTTSASGDGKCCAANLCQTAHQNGVADSPPKTTQRRKLHVLSTPPVSPHTATLPALDEFSSSSSPRTPQPTRPFLPLLEIPEFYHTPSGDVDMLTNLPDTSAKMTMDIDGPPFSDHFTTSSCFDSPHSPSSCTDVTSDNLCPIAINPPANPPLSPPASPPLPHPSLPEPDPVDIPTHSPSPSRRSFASLPELDLDEDVPLFTPSGSLLALPGADTDDDLIPTDLSSPNFIPSPPPTPPSQGGTSTSSLLLINDPNDIPPPRSPSPENFDLDICVDDSADPDLKKLYELRKKAMAAEKAARQLETQLLAQGAVHMRAEARKVRKREKERSKEIGALLRLKLDEMGVKVKYGSSDGAGSEAGLKVGDGNIRTSPKKMISSLPQLVARMMFRRNETFRPLANRKAASSLREYVKSSLSQPAVLADP